MANTYKILGQSNPAATTDTEVYKVGSGKQAIVSSITLANISGSAITYRVRIAIDDAVKYAKPMITPYELEVVLGEKRWEDGYKFDEIP